CCMPRVRPNGPCVAGLLDQLSGPATRRDHSPRTFLTISSAMPVGTSAYESNSIEYDAWPEVLDLRSPTYPNISDRGTSALMTMSPWRSSCDWICPRRLLMSPMTVPRNVSGVITSTANIGSSSTGLAMRAASLKAWLPAILNASSEESTSWYAPSSRETFTSTIGKPARTPNSMASWPPWSTEG